MNVTSFEKLCSNKFAVVIIKILLRLYQLYSQFIDMFNVTNNEHVALESKFQSSYSRLTNFLGILKTKFHVFDI